MPYTSHISVPAVKNEYMPRDMDVVFLVLIVFIACGINDTVVPQAAIMPIIKIQSINKYF